jgi:hypothetical protein
MYRITLPDGRVILTDRPPEKTPGLPGNAKVEPLRGAPALSPEAQAAAQRRLQADKAANEEARRKRQANSAAETQREAAIATARQRLMDAEARAQAESTPRDGDFTAVAGGGTRLNEAYHARQAKAAADVAAARAALDAALQR